MVLSAGVEPTGTHVKESPPVQADEVSTGMRTDLPHVSRRGAELTDLRIFLLCGGEFDDDVVYRGAVNRDDAKHTIPV